MVERFGGGGASVWGAQDDGCGRIRVWLIRVITRKRFEHCIAYTKGNRLSWVERHTHPEMFCYYERVGMLLEICGRDMERCLMCP